MRTQIVCVRRRSGGEGIFPSTLLVLEFGGQHEGQFFVRHVVVFFDDGTEREVQGLCVDAVGQDTSRQ